MFITFKQVLNLLLPQNYLILGNKLFYLCVFRRRVVEIFTFTFGNLILIKWNTFWGTYGDWTRFCYILLVWMFLNHGCVKISSIPLNPNLLEGFLWIMRLMKSAPSNDHPSGISCLFIWTCLAKTSSLISFLLLP